MTPAAVIADALRPRWFAALLLVTLVTQGSFAGIRVLVSYRTLELGGGPAALGLVAATYSLMPLLLAIAVGRRVDRGYAMAVLWGGVALSLTSALLIAAAQAIPVLLVANMGLGMGQLLLTVAGQALIPQSFPAQELNRRFGMLTIGVSAGQAVGVPLAGLIADAGVQGLRVQEALWAMAGLLVLAVPLMLGVMRRPRAAQVTRAQARDGLQSPWRLLAAPGMRPAIFASMATLAAVDIMTAYLPLVGQQAGLGVQLVTALLTVRTLFSILSRLFIEQLIRLLGFTRLLWIASLTGALSMALVPLLPSFWPLALIMVSAGFAFGLTQPMTMTWVSTLADSANRAAVLSIRLAGNRLSQVAVPSLAAAAATVAPAGAVFLITGGMLGAAALSTLLTARPSSGSSERESLD